MFWVFQQLGVSEVNLHKVGNPSGEWSRALPSLAVLEAGLLQADGIDPDLPSQRINEPKEVGGLFPRLKLPLKRGFLFPRQAQRVSFADPKKGSQQTRDANELAGAIGNDNKSGVGTEPEGDSLEGSHTVDGRNPAPPKKPWESVVCWFLQGNHHSRVPQVVRNGFRPSTVGIGL